MSTSKNNNDDVYVSFEILHRLYKLSCQFGCQNLLFIVFITKSNVKCAVFMYKGQRKSKNVMRHLFTLFRK